MVCPKCAGAATLCLPIYIEDYNALQPVPCPECRGSGIVSCCDTAGATYSMVGLYEEAPFTRPEDYWHGIDDES